MSTPDLPFLTIVQLAEAYRRRDISPLEVTRAMLERIERIDPEVHAYITVTADFALRQAKQAEEALTGGEDLGPLHGVPVALKDLYATKAIRTTAHSKVLIDWLPEADSKAASRLHEAGAVLLGKLAMHEFAFGTTGFDLPFEPARNPWDLARVTGGSSSGSGAALAAGLCYGALGSDTGGSIRNPAALCGIVGLKPTYGRVSRRGVVPLSWSLDHVGPMARSVEDCALILQAIAGYDAEDPASADTPVPDYMQGLNDGVPGLRLGVPRDWFSEGEGTDPEVLPAFDAALNVLEGLGARVVSLDAKPFITARAALMLIMIAEAYAYHEQTLKTHPQDLSPAVRSRAREGAFISAADYINAQRARSVITSQLQALLKDVDVIASPSAAQPAERFEEQDLDRRYRLPSYTPVYNLTGLPAISVPCGFTSAGLPIGLQLAGRAFDEATVLRAAQAYESATDWHTHHPKWILPKE
jgi:aspartyl-tRNA(Asn)/glutamyl-tRNA(Gln) amidotransferase subunit A